MPATELAARAASREAKLAALEVRRVLYERAARPIVERMREAALEGRMIDVLKAAADLATEIKDLHVAAYVIGRAGRWSEMTPRDWSAVSAVVATQYGFLTRWAEALASTPIDQVPSLAQLMARAMLYASAARQSFERGMVAELGLDPAMLPAYPGDGSSECRANDRCRWAIRVLSKARGDYDVSWRLGPAEHCPTCRKRARAWKQLQIRGGAWVEAPVPINAD